MSFWDKENCEYCREPVVEKKVEVYRKLGQRYAVVKNVPAGICRSCGARYFSANSLKLFDQIQKGLVRARKEVEVAVYSF